MLINKLNLVQKPKKGKCYLENDCQFRVPAYTSKDVASSAKVLQLGGLIDLIMKCSHLSGLSCITCIVTLWKGVVVNLYKYVMHWRLQTTRALSCLLFFLR